MIVEVRNRESDEIIHITVLVFSSPPLTFSFIFLDEYMFSLISDTVKPKEAKAIRVYRWNTPGYPFQ